MNGPVDREIDEIFRATLALPRRERERFVRQRCGKNAKIERRVLALLAAAETPDQAVSAPFDSARNALWRDAIAEEDRGGEDLSGQWIDGWRVIRRLARGGLATVYLARREDGAFEQQAAFKVLRRGLDTDDVVARFRAERQILSNLDHPSIARILDGGALADGRPFLVLEYVDGVPITRYCEERMIDVRGRVVLLMQVLDALDHAHRHLVVHRDIKPSNILVTAEGRVSLLDFGISKLLDPEALPGAAKTRTGVALLTPGYGSPEQHAGQPVTTASDIYQVGLVAYELIVGTRPFDGPRRPGGTGATAPSRATNDSKARREAAGDLDAIIGKAMHEDPARRYGSALDMRADLMRHLDHRPILARPDTMGYRLLKLARRRPWLVPTLAAGFLAVAGYLATLTVYNRQLDFEKQRAQAAESFMVDLLRSADPFAPADSELGSAITVLEALDLGVERLQSQEFQDPRLRASLLGSIASVYASLDQHEASIELAEQALDLERQIHGSTSSEVLESLALLAGQYHARGDHDAALKYRLEELEIAQRLDPQDHARIGVAQAGAASLQLALGNTEDSGRLYKIAIDRMQPNAARYSGPLINALVARSGILARSDPAGSAQLLQQAEKLAGTTHGAESLSMALVLAQAATNASDQGDYASSQAAFQSALDIYLARLGHEHGATLTAMNNLGVLHMRAGEPERAEQVFSELLALSERKYGRNHRTVAGQYQNLGTVIGRQGRLAEALPHHRQAYEIFSNLLPGHFLTAYPLISMAHAQLHLGDPASAELAAREALELLGDSSANAYATGVARCLAGLALEQQGQDADGAALLVEAQTQLAGLTVDPVYAATCRLRTRTDP